MVVGCVGVTQALGVGGIIVDEHRGTAANLLLNLDLNEARGVEVVGDHAVASGRGKGQGHNLLSVV